MTDDSEDVRRRAASLASAKAEKQAASEVADIMAREELGQLEDRVRTCLEGLPEIEGRWRTRLPTQHPIFELEFQQVALGRDWLTWDRRMAVSWLAPGVFSVEHYPHRYSVDEVIERVKNTAADWIVNWRGLVLECEYKRNAEDAKYREASRQLTESRRSGCLAMIVLAAGVLWYLFGRS